MSHKKGSTKKPKATDFVVRILREYQNTGVLRPAEEIVHLTKTYFRIRYEDHIKNGRQRKSSYLNTAQNYLSRLRTGFIKLGITDQEYLSKIRLPKADMGVLNTSKATTLHQAGLHVPVVPADSMIKDCRDLLTNPDATRGMKVMALACLTGRRMVEIIHTASFDPPTEVHDTHEQYWSKVNGLAKQRNRQIPVEVPLLEQRDEINKSLREIRKMFPCPPEHLPPDEAKAWISRNYSQEMARVMHRFCPMVKKLHDFRKFYAAVCKVYFAEKGASDARIASDFLGHLQMSPTVLTYMNYKVEDVGSLDFSTI